MNRTHKKRFKSPWLYTLTIITLLFICVPMLVSIFAGFVNNYAIGFESGLTTKWFLQVWSSYSNTIFWSIVIALACVLITLIIGVPCAYAFARSKNRWLRILDELIALPITIPGLASALALILAYGQIQWFRQSYLFILVGHVVFTLPFMVKTVTAAFKKHELLVLEEAARSLGATFFVRFLGVLVPAILPSIIAACLMVFTLSIGEFNLTWMLHTPMTRTLPVGLTDSYASMRIEVGSAYTFIFFLVILPFLYGLQTVATYFQNRYGTF
ncbi:Molybdenum transport system permease protein modB [Oligella urethralis]|uniref:ABC transporter permease n=1 Tax=Oligella urethralis TaxID=90245 RepID=UPI000DFD382B|nr:ABC transporter permease subunit [Oligella urethralis]SUA65053.1 Molybdenum transport system permease protein modB [Oligella urethralis]